MNTVENRCQDAGLKSQHAPKLVSLDSDQKQNRKSGGIWVELVPNKHPNTLEKTGDSILFCHPKQVHHPSGPGLSTKWGQLQCPPPKAVVRINRRINIIYLLAFCYFLHYY